MRPYACVDDSQCQQDGRQGFCEPSGWCSFPDPDCDSKRRYGEWAGSGLAGSCVEDDAQHDDTTTTASTSGESTGDVDPVGSGESSTGEPCDTDCTAPGTLLWSIVEDGPDGGADSLLNVAVGDGDRIFVTGYLSVPEQGRDIVVREVSRDGQTVWTQTYDAMEGANEQASGIAIDSEGAVVVSGDVSTTPRRAYLGRYASDGMPLWHLERPGRGFEVAVDGSDDIVVVGGLGDDVWLAKVDPNGDPIWERSDPGPRGFAVGWDLTIDGVGDVIAIGSEDTAEGSRSWLRKYASDGSAPSWSVGLAGVGSGPNEGLGNAMAPDGDVIAVGNMSVGEDYHAWVAKYGPQGQLRWTRGHAGHEGGTANAHHVAVHGDGSIAVVGWKRAADGTFDAWVGRFDPNGDELWSQTHGGDADEHDRAYGVAFDSEGHVIAVGHLHMLDGGHNLWMAKYAP